jgi:hypothetical protein
VYGIGAGPDLDGQLVISHDLLGNFVGEIRPRFVRRYADLDQEVERAFRAYADDVRAAHFPGPEHCYPIDQAEEAAIRSARLARQATRQEARQTNRQATHQDARPGADSESRPDDTARPARPQEHARAALEVAPWA